MGNPAHKEFIKKLRLQQHQKEESSSKNVSKKLYSDCFDEDDDLFVVDIYPADEGDIDPLNNTVTDMIGNIVNVDD